MKMVSQQTVCKSLSDGFDILEMQVQEMLVVPFLNKDILAVIAAIVDVITGIVAKRWRTGHVGFQAPMIPLVDPKGLPGYLSSWLARIRC